MRDFDFERGSVFQRGRGSVFDFDVFDFGEKLGRGIVLREGGEVFLAKKVEKFKADKTKKLYMTPI